MHFTEHLQINQARKSTMINTEQSANDDEFMTQEKFQDWAFSVLVSIGAMSAFFAALIYSL